MFGFSRTRLVAGAALCSVSPFALAAEPINNFECDTLPGHFSYWTRTVSTSAVEVTGTVTVNELRKDKQWTPAATVVLRGGADGKASAGVSLSALLKVTDMYFIKMYTPSGEKSLALGGMVPRTQGPIPFKVALDAAGKLSVSIAGVDETDDLGSFKPQVLSVSCSTGDFEFKDLVVRELSP